MELYWPKPQRRVKNLEPPAIGVRKKKTMGLFQSWPEQDAPSKLVNLLCQCRAKVVYTVHSFTDLLLGGSHPAETALYSGRDQAK